MSRRTMSDEIDIASAYRQAVTQRKSCCVRFLKEPAVVHDQAPVKSGDQNHITNWLRNIEPQVP